MLPIILVVGLLIAVALRLAGKERLSELVALVAVKGIRPLLKGRSQGRE